MDAAGAVTKAVTRFATAVPAVADGVCVGAAIVRADSPEQAARAFASTIHQEEAAS